MAVIFTPLYSPAEVAPLVHSGAGEFYCGLVPPAWQRRFGFQFLNRRPWPVANMKSYEELAESIREAHRYKAALHVTVNGHYYTDEMLAVIRPMLVKLAEIGADAVIVTDPGLMLLLRELDLGLRLDVSTGGMVYNRATLQVFKDLGATRIILPRDITPDEIRALVSSCPDLEYEAFIYSGECLYSDGLCSTFHRPDPRNRLGGPDPLALSCTLTLNGARFVDRTGGRHAKLVEECGKTLKYIRACAAGLPPEARPSCGLCSVRPLLRSGVGSLKVVGRTQRVETRLFMVNLVREAVRIAALPLSDQACVRKTIALRAAIMTEGNSHLGEFETQRCFLGAMCYYPDDRTLAAVLSRHSRQRLGS